jgi:hypothetical protein
MLLSVEGERITYELDLVKRNPEELKKMCGNYSYEYLSMFNHRIKPDIYIGECVIPASNYTIIVDSLQDSTDKDKLSTADAFSEGEKILSEEEPSMMVYDIDNLSSQRLRYFNTSNPTKKCFNCEETGHMSFNCPNMTKVIEPLCFRCNMLGHLKKDCNNIKCFRCHKVGHKINECKEKNLIKCPKCQHFGHEAKDCLLSPVHLNKIPKNLHCFLFNAQEDFPDYNQNVTLKKLFILDNLNKGDDREEMECDLILSCPKCGGKHNYNQCRARKNSFSSTSQNFQLNKNDNFLNKKRIRGSDYYYHK